MKKLFVFFFILAVSMQACTDKEFVLPWEPVTPVPGPSPEPEPDPEPLFKGKPRYVWIDASANFTYFANDEKRIASDLKKVKEMGFTDVVVDVRPTEGTVLFLSLTAPQTRRLAAWVPNASGTGSSYKFVNRTADFDYLQAFITAGHNLGLRVNAAINTFVGGYGGCYGLDDEGPIFSGDIPAEWATVVNYSDGLRSSFSDDVEGTVFLNPANDDVQNYMLTLLSELAAYNLDGIILDRCRFDDSELGSDFSDLTKAKFEDYLGHEVSRWPVFDAGTKSSLPKPVSAEQKSWMSFRAKTIHDFVASAASAVHLANPDIRFGCYVGAWYSSYYLSGVNWASPRYDTARYYPAWADSDYKNYGYADHCDFMLLGCYAAAQSIYGNGEWTMQGFCKCARPILCGDTEFAGGPDVGNPTGWEKGGKGQLIPQTIDACINSADGYFLFDLCHIRMYDYWNDFKRGFDEYLSKL